MCTHMCKWSTDTHACLDTWKPTHTHTKPWVIAPSLFVLRTYTQTHTQLCGSVGLAAKRPVKRGWKWCLSFPVGRGSALHHGWCGWLAGFPLPTWFSPELIANNMLFPGKHPVTGSPTAFCGKKGDIHWKCIFILQWHTAKWIGNTQLQLMIVFTIF